MFILIYLLVFIFWTFYRFNFSNSEIIDEAIFKPIIWIGPLVLLMVLGRFKFKSLNFNRLKMMGLILPALVGLGLAGLQLLPKLFISVIDRPLPDSVGILEIMIIAAGTAITEEILFRGYILGKLLEKLRKLNANLVTALLFTLIHLPLLLVSYSGDPVSILVGLYVIFVSGLTFGFLYLHTKNLNSPILAHFINNLLLSF